jgi:hypothetical protein
VTDASRDLSDPVTEDHTGSSSCSEQLHRPDQGSASEDYCGITGGISEGTEEEKQVSKEKQEKLVARMREWQRLEDATVAQTAKIKMKTDNLLIRLVMEIIQRDSNMHHRIQQLIINSLEKEKINIPVEDLVSIWDSIEQHIEMERKTVELGKVSLAELEGSGNVVQQYLLAFLMRDEEKHDKLLSDLELIKKGMFP